MLKDVRWCSLQSIQPENLKESVTTPTLFQTCPILPILLFSKELCQPGVFVSGHFNQRFAVVQFRSSEANNHIIYAEDFFDDATFEAIKVSFLLTTSWIWDASMARCDGIWISRIKLQVSETMGPWLLFLVGIPWRLGKESVFRVSGLQVYEKEKVSFRNPKLVIDSSFTSSWNSQHLQSV